MRALSKQAQITAAAKRVEKIISGFASQSRLAAGMSNEGYNGGYRDALYDVLLVLNGVRPHRNGWWEWS